MANIQFPSSLEQKVSNITQSDYGYAVEGSYFHASNPTPRTVIATTTSVVDGANAGATSAQTRPVMLVVNNWSASDPNAKTIYPRSLKFRLGQVPTSATFWDMAIWLDTGSSAYTSGGSTIVPVSVNTNISTASQAKVYFGAITAAATTGAGRLVSHVMIDSAIPVTMDEWVFVFGNPEGGSAILSAGATVKRSNYTQPPLAIGPGQALKLGMWGTSNAAAPDFEFEFDFVER